MNQPAASAASVASNSVLRTVRGEWGVGSHPREQALNPKWGWPWRPQGGERIKGAERRKAAID